jgi:hypothetical protein
MATAVETRCPRSEPASRRVLLSCDDSNVGWTLSCADPARRFPDIEAALECARQSPETKTATVEIWQGGQYICCMPVRPWPERGAATASGDAPRLIPYPLLTTAEWYANRAAEATFTRAGPLFWAALIGAVVAASLGWHLL